MQDFRKLMVWQKSHQLTLAVYRSTASFPKAETYGLSSQMCRAAASVPANIAEGCGRGGSGEMGRFLRIAMGSASELHYHIILARDLNMLTTPVSMQLERDVVEVKRMLASLLKKLKTEQ